MDIALVGPQLPPPKLEPLPYHSQVAAYLKREEPELWKWFSSNKVRQEHCDAVRLDLLKSTYRLEEGIQSKIYAQIKEVMAKLNLEVPVTIYQASQASGLNAALAYLPGEAHVILVGPVLTALSELEVKAMLGHELTHFLLFERWDGEILVASEILEALHNDSQAQPCHRETARLFRLYTEILADRGSFAVTGDPLVTIANLVKLETGLMDVSAESYLRQADEIMSKGPVKVNQYTHPETFIRAKAIKLFAEKQASADLEVQKLIEGSRALNQLDLLGQQEVAATTRKLVNHFLAPPWFQTEAVLAHARTFFPDFEPETGAALDSSVVLAIRNSDSSLHEYYGYVLLDFVAADRQLEDAPLASALLLATQLGFDKNFAQQALQELGLTKKRFTVVERDAAKIVQNANQAADGS